MSARLYFSMHLLILVAGQLVGCSPTRAPTEPVTEPADATDQSHIDGPAKRTSEMSTGLDSTEPQVVTIESEPSGDERSASALQHEERDDVAAEPGPVRTEPATHRPERRVASATALRNGMRYRFLIMEGVDPDLDGSGSGYPVPYNRWEFQVRDGDAWAAIYEGPREPLSDADCRIPERYTLEVVDERRPLLLLHARWRWTRCDPGMTLAGPSFEEGTFITVRDDAGAIRWFEFRTRLVLAQRRLLDEAEDGRETWSPVERVDERGELRVRRDGHVSYTWDGHPARATSNPGETHLFGPRANATGSGEVFW